MQIPDPPLFEEFCTIHYELYKGVHIWVERDKAINGYRGFFAIACRAPEAEDSRVHLYGGETERGVLTRIRRAIDTIDTKEI